MDIAILYYNFDLINDFKNYVVKYVCFRHIFYRTSIVILTLLIILFFIYNINKEIIKTQNISFALIKFTKPQFTFLF